MKKLLVAIALLIALPSFAQHYHHHGHWRHGGGNYNWVAPLIIGGVVGYGISRNQQPVIIQQVPAVPVPQGQVCSPWTEIRNPDGTITYTRTCNQN